MGLKQFFTNQYLFQVDSAYLSPAERTVFFAAAALVLLGVVFKISAALALNPVDKKIREKFYHLFLTIGVAELFWYLCRYENARFFGSHFVAWLIVLIGLVWFFTVVASIFRHYKPDKVIWEKEQARLKYLPK